MVLAAGAFGYGLLHGQVQATEDLAKENKAKIAAIEGKIQRLSNQQSVLIARQRDNSIRARERHEELVKQLDRLTDAVTRHRGTPQ